MLRKINGQLEGPYPTFTAYYRGKGRLAKLIMPFTKWSRAMQVEAFMPPKERHLDIGCGDGYLLKRSPCRECWGLDLIYGDRFDGTLAFPKDFFDYVTMLAVLEHLERSVQIFREVHQVLKMGGRFIITTPKDRAEWLMHLYAGKEELDHYCYYDRDAVLELSRGLFRLVKARTFLFGLNQLFALCKI
jgi:2-polyprenyl-3-methyl-5-hydroxy-6-metoxy-1,4-benzoquinol methylase